MREVVYDIAQGIKDGKKLKAVQIGGPMGGCLPDEYLDRPIDYESLAAAGPIMGIYLLSMKLPPTAFIGTSAWFFLLVNTFKVPFSAQLGLITLPSLTFNAMLLPFIALGAWLGIRFARHIPRKVFEVLVQLFAAIGAIKLFF